MSSRCPCTLGGGALQITTRRLDDCRQIRRGPQRPVRLRGRQGEEVAGAVTGNSDLAEEGQLQQADAQARKDANSREAVANASARQAADELREQTQDVAEDKREVRKHADHQGEAVARDEAAEKAHAETEAARHELADRRQAEIQADAQARESESEAVQLAAAATQVERNAREEQSRLESEAADAERRAGTLRAETHSE